MSQDAAWSVLTPLPGAAAGSRTPAVAAIGSTPHIVWAINGTLYHTWLLDGGWKAPARISAGSAPALVTAPDGRLHCLYANEFIGNAEIFCVSWDGARWSYPVNVSHTSGASSQPALALGPDGALHAAWADTTPGQSIIYYGRREAGAAQWINTPVPNARGTSPALGVAPTGCVSLAWQDWLPATRCYEIFYSALENMDWELPADLSASPATHSIRPRLVITADGGCHVVWEEAQGAVYAVYYRRRHPGSDWSAIETLSAGTGDCRAPQMALNPQGFIQAVWLQNASIIHRGRAPRADANWMDSSIACGADALSGELAAAAGADGILHVVTGAGGQRGPGSLYYLRRAPLFAYQQYLALMFG